MPPHQLDPSRVRAILEARGFHVKDLTEQGFEAWLYRPQDPRGSNLIEFSAWIQVPIDYFYGAAPEYDGMPAWEVASRASLDIFLKRHPDRAEARAFRTVLEEHVGTHGEKAPRTMADWAVLFDVMIKAARQAVREYQDLQGSISPPSAL